MWQANLVPAQIGKDMLRNSNDALPRYQRQREGRIDQQLAKLGLRRILVLSV
jgi:hypothetical protein